MCRVPGLFKAYAARLILLLILIVASSALGIVSPFLLRAIIDDALLNGDLGLLARLAGSLIALACFGALIGALQVAITSRVGQAIMHDLRVRVHAHLQALSLGFFTTTRTGEVQSRIASDIGGLQALVTHTASELTRNVSTVVMRTIAMPGHLLARLYDVDAGSTCYDGVDVRDLSFQALTICSAWSPRNRTCSMRPSPTITIVHQLCAVRHADPIVVMDHGQLVEQGGHDELLALGGVYAEMVRSSLLPVRSICHGSCIQDVDQRELPVSPNGCGMNSGAVPTMILHSTEHRGSFERPVRSSQKR